MQPQKKKIVTHARSIIDYRVLEGESIILPSFHFRFSLTVDEKSNNIDSNRSNTSKIPEFEITVEGSKSINSKFIMHHNITIYYIVGTMNRPQEEDIHNTTKISIPVY